MSTVPALGMPSKSFRRALADLGAGLRARELWALLAWQDIKQRYRRSSLGPLWITVGMAVTALALGVVNSALFGTSISTLLPSITTGLILWNFMNGCIVEGSQTFIDNEGMIKQLPAPVSVYALRTVWRQALYLVHNLVVYLLILVVFFGNLSHPYRLVEKAGAPLHPGLSWEVVLALPGLALLLFNGAWVVLLLGVVSTRFRDVPPVIQSFITMLFYATPIMWSMDQVRVMNQGSEDGFGSLAVQVLQLNPVYHFVEIVRAPLVGQQQSWTHWAVAGAVTVVGWALALAVLRNYRARVPYWV
ncbi:galactan export ABC transporter permease subunit Wzm/RfbD [Amycolatopsis panacis]|uniref:ABC transporter permease n=1 Tax=Amycolatopsis panacis TaxID=2340917 RepID=A0A419I0N7_9PSEU|nr:ABC transporter permease [Amycolatopsis panacis]RJQ83165.1 ABC transporter permease [Amycolatopsis panacis]